MSKKVVVKKSKSNKVSYEDIKELTLMEFLDKSQLTGHIRQAYLKKFNINDKFTEKEWLRK